MRSLSSITGVASKPVRCWLFNPINTPANNIHPQFFEKTQDAWHNESMAEENLETRIQRFVASLDDR